MLYLFPIYVKMPFFSIQFYSPVVNFYEGHGNESVTAARPTQSVNTNSGGANDFLS